MSIITIGNIAAWLILPGVIAIVAAGLWLKRRANVGRYIWLPVGLMLAGGALFAVINIGFMVGVIR